MQALVQRVYVALMANAGEVLDRRLARQLAMPLGRILDLDAEVSGWTGPRDVTRAYEELVWTLLRREGLVITHEVAIERARNIVAAAEAMGYDDEG